MWKILAFHQHFVGYVRWNTHSANWLVGLDVRIFITDNRRMYVSVTPRCVCGQQHSSLVYSSHKAIARWSRPVACSYLWSSKHVSLIAPLHTYALVTCCLGQRTTKRRNANWVVHILRRNCLKEHVVEGKIEGRIEETGRRRKRCTQLLDGLKEKGGYWKMKEETVDRTVWRIRVERSFGPSVRQNEWMNEWMNECACLHLRETKKITRHDRPQWTRF